MPDQATQATATPVPDLPPQYRPADHESRIRARWERSDAFHADPARVLSGQVRPYAILIPPPNVTAALHLGHALNNTLQDVLIRAHRMMGFETLWMPGTDHAGIATQTVVEKRLIQTEGKKRTDYSRDEFIAKVQTFKDEYEARITEQLRAMGCSCDWPRQRFTMDPICARAVREAFFRLFRDGLIERGKRLVNWDPATQTALADDEVEMVEVDGHFYYLRYPLVHQPTNPGDPLDTEPVTWGELTARGCPGADAHPQDEPAWITVATTRPETYLGDTAVAVNPADPRAHPLRGLFVQLPIVGRVIPVIEDDYVVMPAPDAGTDPADDSGPEDPKARYATGFLKVTPAHDPNDWEIGRRHDLPVINVLAPDGSISDQHGWNDVSGAHIFVGTSREQAAQLVIREFRARQVGPGSSEVLLEEIKPYRHSVGHSYRSHVPIEPYLSDQWYVKVTDDRLVGSAQRALAPEQRTHVGLGAPFHDSPGDGDLRFFPDRYARNYESWHDNLRDWCISRQLWWGHRIPVWRNESLSGPPEELDRFRDQLARWQEQGRIWRIDRGGRDPQYEDPNMAMADFPQFFICVRDASDDEIIDELERRGYEQDPDVLDTWFSSALWPLSTLGWPDAGAAARQTGIDDFPDLLGAFNPTDVLCTAREIITLWVSRMVMFNRYFLSPSSSDPSDGRDARPTRTAEGQFTPGRLPFRDVFIHAMIQDGQGRKMSKSLGNGVDPLDIIHSHGADAMRYTLCHMTTQTQDVRMPVEPDPETGRNTSPKFDIGRNFANKLWNATRFALGILSSPSSTTHSPGGTGDPPVSSLSLADRWILSRLEHALDAINDAMENYQFSQYAQVCYDLLWRDFCDWYLEAIKPTVSSDPRQRTVLRCVLDAILRLIHPIMPFITEALYERLASIPAPTLPVIELSAPRSHGLLCTAGWPVFTQPCTDEHAERLFDRVRLLVAAIREVRASHNVPPRRRIVLHMDADLASELDGSDRLLKTLAGLDRITSTPPSEPSVAFAFESVQCHLSDLAEAVDHDAERRRMEQRIEELDRTIAALERRLANPGYIAKAPANLVQQTRDQLAQAGEDRRAAEAALERLG